MADNPEILAQLREPAGALRRAVPDVFSGYSQLHRAAMGAGELSTQTKELIALAIAIVKRCDGCIASHARSAVRAGVTEQQLAEMVGVAMLLDGGPATVYGPRAWEAFQQFKQQGGEASAPAHSPHG